MTRIALGIEYDGAEYSGWQRQAHARSVQAALEGAISAVACHPVEVAAAGRTDAGVHALGQVVHFDTAAKRPDRAWVRGVNSHLPADIGVRWVAHPGAGFDARRSGLARRYQYLLQDTPLRPVLARQRVGWTWQSMDVAAMAAAAAPLIGEHDFSSFRAAGCQAPHAVRRLLRLDVYRQGGVVVFDVEANAFLHHMVRNLVGSLMQVGSGERSSDWLAEVLAARDRRRAGVTAPAAGLYLLGVRYPPGFGLPDRPPAGAFACVPGQG
ncbi:tRNA pseudouridine(38-40) synthase TruA [Spiribacter pallidus]|uniref:tRNA pseudouridine synthase A n=1 Tax=Spiribacter pallidus TaxID=1987936 RepID=A0ABV3TBE3_9GAMM